MIRKLLLALLAPLLAVAGCAREADQQVLTADDALAALRAAPEAAAEAGSARFEMTISFETPEGGFEITATGGYRGGRMAMSMDVGAALADLAREAGEELPPGFDEPVQVVVEGTTAYLRVPMLDSLTGTSGWLSARAEDVAEVGGSLGLDSATYDPSKLLDTLRGMAEDLEVVGTEEVRGVRTTHLRGTVDLAAALDEVPELHRDEVEAQLEQLGGALSAMPVDVWVDGDGLVRRFVLTADAFARELGEDGSAEVRLELFDYGEPVDIELPDPADTTDISTVLGGFLGALG